MDIANLIGMRASLAITVGDEVVHVVYDPSKIDYSFVVAKTGFEGIFDLLAEVIVEWDLTYGGEPLPITSEGVRKLPLFVAQKINTEISAAVNDGEPGKNSPAT